MAARHFYPIDILRFSASLSVLIFHFGFYSWASDYSSTAHAFGHVARFELLAPWTWFGWIGVQVFFVISGFVIANSANSSTPMAFLRGRIARLYPATSVCALVSLAALVFIVGDPIRSLAMPFLRAVFLDPTGPWIDGVYWSLAVEIAFYFVIFCLLVFGKFGSIRLVAWGLTLWSGAFLIVTFCFENPTANPHWWLALNASSEILLLRHGCFFAVGIWLWLADRQMLGPWGSVGLLLAIAVGCGEILLHVHEDILGGASAWANTSAVAPIAFWLGALAVIHCASRYPDFWTPRSERGRSAVRRIGSMTYPLYLVHNVAGVACSRMLIIFGLNPIVALVSAATGMIALSYVICRFWEPAARAYLQRGLDKLEVSVRGRSKQLEFLFAPGGACEQTRGAR